MSDDIESKAAYYEEIRTIADNIVKEAEGDEDRAYDLCHETVDGHQWIIYTRYCYQVITFSDNENAHFDNYGALEADNASDAMTKMAFAAMLQDVQDALPEALERWQENT